MASTRREQGWPRARLVASIVGSMIVFGAAATTGGVRALALVGGWLGTLGLAAWRLGADSRDGADWKPLSVKPLNALDRLAEPLYAPHRLEEPSREGDAMNPILAAELARARMDSLHRAAAAGRLLTAAAARPRWRRAVGARLVRIGVHVAAGWKTPAGAEYAASLLRPDC
jgi:hypothetical protein